MEAKFHLCWYIKTRGRKIAIENIFCYTCQYIVEVLLGKQKKSVIYTLTPTKCFNRTLALITFNYVNLIVIYHTLGEICASNQAEILIALNNDHCLVSSVIVTVNATSLN